MEDLIIRSAEDRDCERLSYLLQQICEFHVKGRPDVFKSGQKYSLSELSTLIRDPERPVFVAELDGLVVGYAFCILKRRANDPVLRDMLTVYVDDLCVDENCRRGGVGRALFEHVKAYARSIGAYNIDLNVWEFPGSAVDFYEKMGMKTERRYMELIL